MHGAAAAAHPLVVVDGEAPALHDGAFAAGLSAVGGAGGAGGAVRAAAATGVEDGGRGRGALGVGHDEPADPDGTDPAAGRSARRARARNEAIWARVTESPGQ